MFPPIERDGHKYPSFQGKVAATITLEWRGKGEDREYF